MKLLGWGARARFYRQLGQLLRSGLAMDVALPLAADVADSDYRQRAKGWAAGCAGGRDLAGQLADEPPTVVALIRAGERSGRLPEVCERIADLTDQARALRASLLSRLWYPAVLLHAVFIVPALPGLILGTGSSFGFLVGPLILWALVGAVALAARQGVADGLVARAVLSGPLRGLAVPLLADRLCLVVGAAHGAGLLHREALFLGAAACGNRILAERLRAAAEDLEARRLPSLAAALEQAGLDRTTVALITAAEVGGRLEEGFRHASQQNRQAFAHRADLTVRLFSGLVYGLILLYVAMTIVQMYGAVYGGAMEQLQGE